MKNEVEAVQAISMLHSQEYFEQQITVKLLRPDDPDNPTRRVIPRGLKKIGRGLGVGE